LLLSKKIKNNLYCLILVLGLLRLVSIFNKNFFISFIKAYRLVLIKIKILLGSLRSLSGFKKNL